MSEDTPKKKQELSQEEERHQTLLAMEKAGKIRLAKPESKFAQECQRICAETWCGSMPHRLEIEGRPELNVFPFNVLFSQVRTRDGKVLVASALYEPDLASFESGKEERSMKYHNVYGGDSWLMIKHNLSNKHYSGEKVVNGETFGFSMGEDWQMFFLHFTTLGLVDGEHCWFLDPILIDEHVGEFAEKLLNEGAVYGETNRYEKAVGVLKQAIYIKPDYAEAYYSLGTAYGNQGRYTEAIAIFKQAISIKPAYAEAYYGQGWIYERLGCIQEAIDAYKQAIHLQLEDADDAYYRMGNIYSKLGRYLEAIDAFEQAIRIKPYHAEAHNNLGVSYEELGRYPEAVDAYYEAVRLKPDYVLAIRNLGGAYLLCGKKGFALEEYRILKDMDSNLAKELFNLIHK